MSNCGPETFGADPVRVKWSVIRGDTSTIRIDFLDDDEITHFDTSGWIYKSTAYDPKTDILDELTVVSGNGYVEITAPASLTEFWGKDIRSTIVTEMSFDLQVTTTNNIVWTPVIGNIVVSGDVTGGTL